MVVLHRHRRARPATHRPTHVRVWAYGATGAAWKPSPPRLRPLPVAAAAKNNRRPLAVDLKKEKKSMGGMGENARGDKTHVMGELCELPREEWLGRTRASSFSCMPKCRSLSVARTIAMIIRLREEEEGGEALLDRGLVWGMVGAE